MDEVMETTGRRLQQLKAAARDRVGWMEQGDKVIVRNGSYPIFFPKLHCHVVKYTKGIKICLSVFFSQYTFTISKEGTFVIPVFRNTYILLSHFTQQFLTSQVLLSQATDVKRRRLPDGGGAIVHHICDFTLSSFRFPFTTKDLDHIISVVYKIQV